MYESPLKDAHGLHSKNGLLQNFGPANITPMTMSMSESVVPRGQEAVDDFNHKGPSVHVTPLSASLNMGRFLSARLVFPRLPGSRASLEILNGAGAE